jgi:RimJ/RimL family protein N-acetyltransferase
MALCQDSGVDRQPHLIGELVELRPLEASDFAPLYAIASDPLMWEQHPSKDRTEVTIFREWFDKGVPSGGAVAIIDRRDGSVIGTSRFDHYVPARSEIEIGWTMLARSHWGGAYNGEVKQLMLHHAFDTVQTVIFRVHSLNLRSQRAVEKLGAIRTGTELDADGRGENFVYSLRAADYLA